MCLILPFLFINNYNIDCTLNDLGDNWKNDIGKLKSGDTWILSPFIIDDNGSGDYTWDEAVLQPWCSGTGSKGNPYIIENVTVDSVGLINCIEIRNSNSYFILRFCDIIAINYAAIKLENVSNGILTENDCSFSSQKIWLVNSFNNTIFKNTFNGTSYYYDECYGIRLERSSYNSIIENDLFYGGHHPGIFLNESSDNTIKANHIHYFAQDAIFLIDSHNNSLKENYIELFAWGSGFYLENSDNNTILDNSALVRGDAGLELINCKYNNISGNYLGSGIRIRGNLLEASSQYIDNSNYGGSKLIYYFVNTTGLNSANLPDLGQLILVNCQNSNISDLNIGNYVVEPISLLFCNNITISNVTVLNNNGDGIVLYFSNNSLIKDCILTDSDHYGILLEYSQNVKILSTNISYCGSYGIRLLNGCDNNTISGNYIFENYLGIELNGIINDGKNNIIENNTLYNNEWGGVWLFYRSNNIIERNKIFGTGKNPFEYGIRSSNYNIISNNLIKNHLSCGISVHNNNTIFQNKIFDNKDGLQLNGMFNNVINNTIYNNTQNGIFLEYSSYSNNTIWGNNISFNNGTGVYIKEGSFNLFYRNVFNNPIGINAKDNGNNNSWNNLNIGNYWEDYPYSDIDDDKIGDIPYIITGTSGSRDYYPIWEDADDSPFIIILSPENQSVLTNPPSFSVEIRDIELDKIWYTVDKGLINYTINGFTGVINQSIWDSLSDGELFLTFYANDSANNIGYNELILIKDTKAPIITIYKPETNEEIGRDAPAFKVFIDEAYIDTMWYSLNEGLTNYTFITNGTINEIAWQTIWDSKIDGDIIKIMFFANDSVGKIGSDYVVIKIFKPTDPFTEPTDSKIPGFNLQLILILILGFNILYFRKRKEKSHF